METKNVPAEEVKKTEAEGEQVKDTKEEETVTLKKSEVDAMLNAAEAASKIAESKTKAAKDLTAGIDKYKRMLKDNGIEDEEEKPQLTSKEEIAQMIRDAVKEVIPTVVKPKEDDELTIANNKIAEMRIAMANSKKSIPSSAGSNLEKDNDTAKSAAETYFSEEQKAEIKKMYPNISLEEVYKKLPKDGDRPGAVK